MNHLIDTGANLTVNSFTTDLDEVIQRAISNRVEIMIVTGSNLEDSRAAIELARLYPENLYSTAGIHPHHADSFDQDTIRLLRELHQNDSVVAIGECGLDFNRNYSISGNQIKAFEAQLALAVELNKPVFLHQRDAHEDFVSILQNCITDLSGAVAHCFTGNADEANQYIDMGLYIGITGWICDERRGHDLQEAVKHIPLDKIMLETDAPYLLPRDLKVKPVHSRRNEPCFLPHICEITARYMGIDSDELAAATVENTKRFFGI